MPLVQRCGTRLRRLRERLAGLRSDASRQALVEYALPVAAVVTLVVSVTLLFGPAARDLLGQGGDRVAAQVDGAGSGGQGGGSAGNGNHGNAGSGNDGNRSNGDAGGDDGHGSGGGSGKGK